MQLRLLALWESLRKKKAAALWTWGLICAAALLVIVLSESAGMAANTQTTTPSAFSTLGLSLNIVFKLGFVILLIYVSLMLLKRFQNRVGQPGPKQLGLMETLHLSPRQSLHLVRAGEQVYLVGATDQNLGLIATVELIDELQVASQPTAIQAVQSEPAAFPSLNTFASQLGALMGKR